jgi:hypothetical protein
MDEQDDLNLDKALAAEQGQELGNNATDAQKFAQSLLQMQANQQAARETGNVQIPVAERAPAPALEGPSMQEFVAPFVKDTPAEVPGVNTVLKPQQQVLLDEAAAQESQQALEAELAKQKLEQDAALAEQARINEAQKVQNEAKAQTKAAERVEQKTEQARTEVPEESPEDGLSMRQAFALLLGGISQGLTGAQQNPAFVMIEAINNRRMRRIEQEAKQKQWTEEHKLAVQRAELEKQMNEARIAHMKTEDQLTRAKIGELQAKALKELQAIAQQQQLYALEKQRGLTMEELRSLSPEEQEFYVQLPNGNFTRTVNKVRAKELSSEISDVETARNNVSELINLVDEVGNNPLKKLFDRDTVAKAQTLQQSTIGKLRLELFGPGVLTDFEQKIARNILRDPTSMLSLASANKTALKTLQQKLKYGQIKRIEAAGGVVPDYMKKNELMLAAAQKKYPKAKKADLITALIKQGKWQDE